MHTIQTCNLEGTEKTRIFKFIKIFVHLVEDVIYHNPVIVTTSFSN